MNQIQLAYLISRLFEGEKEISGSQENPLIIDFHKATTLRATEDEVPWCSSFMNFCQLQACLMINPGLMTRYMNNKGMSKDIACMVKHALIISEKLKLTSINIYLKNVDLTKTANQLSNAMPIIEPTYSALAASWKTWGVETYEPQIGDLVVFKRRPDGSGSGHISFFNGWTGNEKKMVFCFGGNQSNSVCDSTYEFERVVTYRTLR